MKYKNKKSKVDEMKLLMTTLSSLIVIACEQLAECQAFLDNECEEGKKDV